MDAKRSKGGVPRPGLQGNPCQKREKMAKPNSPKGKPQNQSLQQETAKAKPPKANRKAKASKGNPQNSKMTFRCDTWTKHHSAHNQSSVENAFFTSCPTRSIIFANAFLQKQRPLLRRMCGMAAVKPKASQGNPDAAMQTFKGSGCPAGLACGLPHQPPSTNPPPDWRPPARTTADH